MVVYEVNLSVNSEIRTQFWEWLKKHVADMLNIQGFQHADIMQEQIPSTESSVNWTVIYKLDSMKSLEQYFEKHAPKMRDQGLARFADQFSASRRIFDLVE